ncbi:hypothetical protein C8Q74DRAFT_292683 [Fomes fomentarius]|nr:hypothetical protein C8Q74DRAFT_292683 [Fomes fomentarius]
MSLHATVIDILGQCSFAQQLVRSREDVLIRSCSSSGIVSPSFSSHPSYSVHVRSRQTPTTQHDQVALLPFSLHFYLPTRSRILAHATLATHEYAHDKEYWRHQQRQLTKRCCGRRCIASCRFRRVVSLSLLKHASRTMTSATCTWKATSLSSPSHCRVSGLYSHPELLNTSAVLRIAYKALTSTSGRPASYLPARSPLESMQCHTQ